MHTGNWYSPLAHALDSIIHSVAGKIIMSVSNGPPAYGEVVAAGGNIIKLSSTYEHID